MFLYQIRDRAVRHNDKVKFLEIGLGCDSVYGTGASVPIWKQMFTPGTVIGTGHGSSSNGAGGNAEYGQDATWTNFLDLWVADIDGECVKRAQEAGQLDGVASLVGNQSDPEDIHRWIRESSGNFTVIVDDGGHGTDNIITTFNILWPNLAPGGLYFIEDLQIQRAWLDDQPPFADIMNSWIEQLLVRKGSYSFEIDHITPYIKDMRQKYPIPKRLKWILCQAEACVLAKCHSVDASFCM
mmetsp:Transcript_7245/g.7487  ORF Transcript_7245/g.7487 Transcript_7245/m.7487 type:complete len:240 (+) Transcript_7245:486-1205(+)|eukprot:CAMPEP_0182427436 /NCGR_PEP_ID=MMETSP1167-20130531/17172_1 /TAXON_ID=2988 /ORGANISM="Mallomonas Sp, Strain CCMP3275" /LENGTH=239 /DNA_ID=CAMNT_0024609665 /DNA_START=321 /DNA_END=1040 /DNA_ORIENTATION=+